MDEIFDKDNCYDLDDDYKLCYEFQKRYAASHPLERNFHHNLYLCKTVDQDGNVTDVKYGMNALTDWGMFYTMTSYQYRTDAPSDAYGNANYYRDSCKIDGNMNYGATRILFGIGSGDGDYPDHKAESFPNQYGKDDSFILSSRYHSQNDGGYQDFQNGVITSTVKLLYGYYDYQVYNSSNIAYTEDAELGRISLKHYGFNSGSWKNVCPIIATYSYIYDGEGNKTTITKKPNEKLYVTIYATCVMDPEIYNRLYEKNIYAAFSTTSMLKFLAHGDTSYQTTNSSWKMYDNIGKYFNKFYVMDHSYNILKYGDDNSNGTGIFMHWQQFNKPTEESYAEEKGNKEPDNAVWNNMPIDERLQYWYGKPIYDPNTGEITGYDGIQPKKTSDKNQAPYWAHYTCMPDDMTDLNLNTSTYSYLVDKSITVRKTADENFDGYSRLFEDWQDRVSHVVYTDHPMNSDDGRYMPCHNFHLLAWTFPQLQQPEELRSLRFFTTNAYDPTFPDYAFGIATSEIIRNKGDLPVTNFTITSLKRYNYSTHEWDINIPFEAHPECVYDNDMFNCSAAIRIMINGIARDVMVYINAGKHTVNGVTYPGYHDILQFTNSDIKTICASDTFWDPSTWVIINRNDISNAWVVTENDVLVKTVNGEPNPIIGTTQNLRHKRYYIMTNPTWNLHSITTDYPYTSYGAGAEYLNLSPRYDRQLNKVLNSDPINITTINGKTLSEAQVYQTWNYTWSYDDPAYFKMISNDDPNVGPLWSVMGRSVVYYNNDITNIIASYPLTQEFTQTAGWDNKAFSPSSRWKYKNRVLIAQKSCMGQLYVYDLSNPEFNNPDYTIPKSRINIHTIAKTYTVDSDQFAFTNDGKYVSHFIMEYNNTYINTQSPPKSWVIDIGEPDEDPAYYTFTNALFIVPIMNTSLMIARFAANKDGTKTVTIFDMDVYKTEYAELIAEREALPVDDPSRKTDLEIQNEALIEAVVNPIEEGSIVTFEIPLTSTNTSWGTVIRGATGFNEHVYVSFYDGSVNHTWYYNINTQELSNMLEWNPLFKDRFYFCNPYTEYNYPSESYCGSGSHRGWTSQYHTCTTDGSTGEGIFILNLISYTVGDDDNGTGWASFWIIKENDPKNLLQMSHKAWTGGSSSLMLADFEIKYVNNQQLVLFTRRRHVCYTLSNYASNVNIICWDLGLWLDDSSRDLYNYTAYARNEGNSVLIGVSEWGTRHIVGNDIVKDKMVMLNQRDNRIELVPVHNFLNFKVTGTTTTIQAFNNPKKITLKHPITVVMSNTGLSYHGDKRWMGIPSYQELYDHYNNGDTGWDANRLKTYVKLKLLTADQYYDITGETYTE